MNKDSESKEEVTSYKPHTKQSDNSAKEQGKKRKSQKPLIFTNLKHKSK